MNDDELVGVWATLGPTVGQRQRIQARVFERLDARGTSLAAEWLGLFKVAPLPAFGLVVASTASLVTAMPIVWIARALL